MKLDNTIIGAVGTIAAVFIGIFFARKKKEDKETAPTRGGILIKTQAILSPGLEDALALAELQSKREGEKVTSTHHFFSAIARLKPNSLASLIAEFNKIGALPEPTSEDLFIAPRKLTYERSLSPCVTESLENLSVDATEKNKVTATDVFVDVSKYGEGSSVTRMRDKGIEPKTIDMYVKKYGIELKHYRK